jgi:hypothetical protein
LVSKHRDNVYRGVTELGQRQEPPASGVQQGDGSVRLTDGIRII